MTGSISESDHICISNLKKLKIKRLEPSTPKDPEDFQWDRIIKSAIFGLMLMGAIILNFHTSPVKALMIVAPTPTPLPDLILQPIKTISLFEKKQIQTTEIILRQTTYKDDPEVEAGIENTLDEGEDGKKINTIEVSYYKGVELDRQTVKTEVIPPKDKIIQRGTKIVWKTLDTPDGTITYWKKIRVYATDYDSHCPGCDDWTAMGLRQGKGVIAVDPTVIKMLSKVYVPGYGVAVAGDTGGAIKGNKIDLGFEDARTSGWISHYIEIYLM